MKFLRFSNTDSNYSTTGHTHIWDLPLSLEHRKVGLSSFSLSIANDVESLKEEVLEIKCSLLDRSMENQRAILEIIPIRETFKTFSKSPAHIGLFLSKLHHVIYLF